MRCKGKKIVPDKFHFFKWKTTFVTDVMMIYDDEFHESEKNVSIVGDFELESK
jgi:hypothetical protein